MVSYRDPVKRGKARPACVALLALGLGGCDFADRVLSGRAFAPESLPDRPAPPGFDGTGPHLGMVPARPSRPDPAGRRALDESLAADRAAATRPLDARGTDATGFSPSLGNPPIPAAPPAPPALRTAAPIPWDSPPRAAAGTPATTPRETAPAAPPAELLAPRPPPAELMAPPPPPPPGLLAPR